MGILEKLTVMIAPYFTNSAKEIWLKIIVKSWVSVSWLGQSANP